MPGTVQVSAGTELKGAERITSEAKVRYKYHNHIETGQIDLALLLNGEPWIFDIKTYEDEDYAKREAALYATCQLNKYRLHRRDLDNIHMARILLVVGKRPRIVPVPELSEAEIDKILDTYNKETNK